MLYRKAAVAVAESGESVNVPLFSIVSFFHCLYFVFTLLCAFLPSFLPPLFFALLCTFSGSKFT